jgi:hypothetical protein
VTDLDPPEDGGEYLAALMRATTIDELGEASARYAPTTTPQPRPRSTTPHRKTR